jgi:flagellar hook assembly protein FlgD
VTLKIYNILGQEVKTLVNAPQADGDYTVSWDGRDADGREASSGIYIYRLDAGLFTATKQMMLIR